MSSEEQKYQRNFDDKDTIDDLILLDNVSNETITDILQNRYNKNWIYVSSGYNSIFTCHRLILEILLFLSIHIQNPQ